MRLVRLNQKQWPIYEFTGDDGQRRFAGSDAEPLANERTGELKPGWECLDNLVFEGTLQPVRIFRARSTIGIVFQLVDTGSEVTMRFGSLESFIKSLLTGHVQITPTGFLGEYTFAKQGAMYSIEVASQQEKETA